MKMRVSLLLFVLLSLVWVGCGASSIEVGEGVSPVLVETAVSTTQNIPSNTPTLTATNTPTPSHTPTLEPTATATATPTPTIEPTPTVDNCNLSVIEEAMTSLNLLDSYQVTNQLFESQEGEMVYGLQVETAVLLADEAVVAYELTVDLLEPEERISRSIFVDGLAFYREGQEEWLVIEGQVGQASLQRLTETQYLQSGLLGTLEAASCFVRQSTLDGLETTAYSFYAVDLTGWEGAEGLRLTNSNGFGGLARVEIWLLPIEKLLVPKKAVITFDYITTQTITDVELVIEYNAYNEPVDIEFPENFSRSSFFIDIPLPEDAEITNRGENILTFVTRTSVDEILDQYVRLLSNLGWETVATFQDNSQGILLEVIEFASDSQELVFAAGEEDGVTIVIFAGGDAP